MPSASADERIIEADLFGEGEWTVDTEETLDSSLNAVSLLIPCLNKLCISRQGRSSDLYTVILRVRLEDWAST